MEALALLLIALVFGGMVCFSFLFAPAIFARLPADSAATLVRGFFPRYYVAIAVLSAAAAPLMVAHHGEAALGLFAVAGLAVYARNGLMPAINRARDRELAGDSDQATRFARLHGASVAINLVQIGLLGWALWVLAP